MEEKYLTVDDKRKVAAFLSDIGWYCFLIGSSGAALWAKE